MKSRLFRHIKWRIINCYIRQMLRLFGDGIKGVSTRLIHSHMKKSPPDQRYFVDALNASSNIDWLEQLSNQRLQQLDFLHNLNWHTINQLKSFCRELPVNYKNRFPVADKFLEQLDELSLKLISQNELISKILESIDQFCSGDINAVDEINGT